jgi:3-oxoacyl-[acyl-carrier protein] reductase
MGILEGKRALVTGASRGIGRAIAEAFVAEGAGVVLNYNRGAEEAEAAVRAIAENGGPAYAVQADVADEDQAERLISETVERLGGIDILVNNAGVLLEKPLLETTAADFDWLMNINLRGNFLVGREAIRRMVHQGEGGRVINVSSDLGFVGRETFSVYCASKGAINTLTKAWAREFAPDILVNAVAPGPVDTDMLDLNSMSPEWREKEEAIPLRRVGQPEEIAALALFLAGPGASFMTGQIVGANGGSAMP